ncbi:4-alpha-glucanotransferase [Marinimicrobium sp. ABcell2]|uniref:4-alpha-glucanotransferase n=1 Tax=Marinimicrobium sp. ABcell2 TaxID=3069751 RepID=UPI0027AF1A79|nr:4-alpha-glucanotransferase [Marinimicrobium sp. ABcell2]MDQ2075499.1 4-alpha-glucanotransferase [Marinimicrobium sp. ABcell2]
MTKTTSKHLSTTALARHIGKESKELFVLLANSGWIVKVDGRWQLTEKGKFEGGIYVNHPKFGDYIAWPETVQTHPLLSLLPEAPLTASNLGSKFKLPARQVNLLLAERGWLRKAPRGWFLTPAGRAMGGQQQESEQSGIPFVTWPETLLNESALLTAVAQVRGETENGPALDGHEVSTRGERLIDNWLYLAGVVHARKHALALPDGCPPADFYLPALGLCIEYWSDDAPPGTLAENLQKQEVYKKVGQEYVEIHEGDLEQLDEILARALLRHGLAIY